MNSPFLRIADVTKHYRDRAAVAHVSFEIQSGESVVILGPSGCGKTTLLRLVAGLARPDSGAIWLDETSDQGSTFIITLSSANANQHYNQADLASAA